MYQLLHLLNCCRPCPLKCLSLQAQTGSNYSDFLLLLSGSSGECEPQFVISKSDIKLNSTIEQNLYYARGGPCVCTFLCTCMTVSQFLKNLFN